MQKKLWFFLLILLFKQYSFAQAPTITSFSPTTAGEGDTVTIIGTGFTTGFEDPTYVYLGGNAVSSISVSSTTIKALVATGYSGDVTVQNDSGMASLQGFTYNSNPIINSVVPDTASAGQTVTITGKYLVFGAIHQPPTVSFGGVAATSVTAVTSFSTVKAVVGNGASGIVSLTTPFGTTTYPIFIYKAATVINSFSPTSAPTGTTITIKGDNFTGATSVTFGTVAAKSFTVVSDTVITALVGNGASGNIIVTAPFGPASIAGFTFTTPCTVTTSSMDTAICSSRLPYNWNGKIIYSAGTYIDTLINAGGCDSIAILNVVVIAGVAPPIVTSASRCNAGAVTLEATPSAQNDILKWYSDTTLTMQIATGTSFTTPSLGNTITYYVTESNASGCISISIDATATINRIPVAPAVNPVVYYQQNQTTSALTTMADNGDTLLWYTTATGGSGSNVAPIPSTTALDTTAYYVSQKGPCGESPRAAITVIIESSVPIQICSQTGYTFIVSNVISNTYNYQWQLNTGSGFNNITADSNYEGVNDSLLILTQIPSSWYGYQYRCIASGTTSNVYTLKFTDTWTGAAHDSNWMNAANWSCGRVPDNNTDVIINSGTVVLSFNTTVRSLTVSPGASFTIATPYTLTVTH